MFADKYHHQRLRLLNEMAAAGIPASLVDRLLKDFFKEAVSAAEMASIKRDLESLDPFGPWAPTSHLTHQEMVAAHPRMMDELPEVIRYPDRDVLKPKTADQLLALGDGEVEFDRNFKPKNRS